MRDAELFLWPRPRFSRQGIFRHPGSAEKVEERLRLMFPGGYPVLVSSGRVGLVLALAAAGLHRESLVGIFPYASHCVIEAVGRVATPLAGPLAPSAEHRIVYHQWGVVQEPPASNILIEDAVDTLCEPDTDLFPSGSSVEIWSLPKLLGSLGGGVVWCANAELASEIRALRDDRPVGTSLRWAIRLAASRMPRLVPFWYGAESLGGPMPSWAIGDVAAGMDRWQGIVEDRHRKLATVLPFAPAWYELMPGRLPPVVPVAVNDTIGARLVGRGLSHGFRHFERVNAEGRTLERVFPIPIHQDVTDDRLESLLSIVVERG